VDESRRNFLKMGAGIAGVGAMTGLAGCNQIPFAGGGIGGGFGNAFYKNWMYAPDTFVDDQEHYSFTAYKPVNWGSNEDNFDEDYYDSVESSLVDSRLAMTGLDLDEIDQYISLEGRTASVVRGSYNTEDVIEELDDNDSFEEEGETDTGYTVYLDPTNQQAVGVSGDAIIVLHSVPQGVNGGGGEVDQPTPPATATPTPTPERTDARSISFGETIQGYIDENDPDGRRGNYEPVTFQGTEGETVTITMISEDDPYLILLDPDGQEVARNDDAFDVQGSLNSQIEGHTLQQSGQYTIVATSFSSFDTFAYRLRLERGSTGGIGRGSGSEEGGQSTGDGGEDLRSISYGETRTGEIRSGDPTREGELHEPVTFQGSAGDVVSIDMVANGDPLVRLVDPDGQEVAANDDFNGLDSRIESHTLEESGEYTIIATSYSSDEEFTYTLRLQLEFSPDVLEEAISTISMTQNGETTLYESEVDPAGTLFSALGGGDFATGTTMEEIDDDVPEQGRFDNMVARGTAVSVNGETSNVKSVVVYDDADDFDDGAIEDWTDEAEQWDDVDDINISQSGNVATITGKIDTDDLGT
jgi:hypothetical protein